MGIVMGTGAALLSWRVDVGGSRTTVVFEGEILEQADFRELEGKLVSDLEFDMRGIRRVNSAGAHRWVEFVRSLPPAARLAFVYCSPAVVLQVNLIQGFLGHGAVRTFYAPYSCDRCDGHHLELLHSRDVRKSGWLAPEVDCAACQVPMEFDDDPARYFAFTRPQR